jgi:hypothetical protein
VNIAELIATVLDRPATRVLNAADPEAPDVTAIGAAVAAVYGADLRLVPMTGPPQAGVGASPWSVERPLVVSMERALALGYRPVASYAEAVGAACRSAEASIQAGVELPPYMRGLFDYRGEDAWLEAHS